MILLALMYGEDAAELGPWLASLPEGGHGLEWGALTDAQAAHFQCPELVRLMDSGSLGYGYSVFCEASWLVECIRFSSSFG